MGIITLRLSSLRLKIWIALLTIWVTRPPSKAFDQWGITSLNTSARWGDFLPDKTLCRSNRKAAWAVIKAERTTSCASLRSPYQRAILHQRDNWKRSKRPVDAADSQCPGRFIQLSHPAHGKRCTRNVINRPIPLRNFPKRHRPEPIRIRHRVPMTTARTATFAPQADGPGYLMRCRWSSIFYWVNWSPPRAMRAGFPILWHMPHVPP